MVGQKEYRPFLPAFLGERSARRALQNLYVAIVGSTHNANALVETDPININGGLARGNQLVKNCFIAASTWLKNTREFVLSEKIFLEQILEPARHAAGFMIDIRTGFSHPGTVLKGIIFSKSSPYYSKFFGDYRITLSVILPEIESVMSLRCSAAASSNVGYGTYEISGVQPVPFLNRIHQLSSFSIQSKNQMFALSDLDFMKISFHDVNAFSRSFAFENFCEIESDQLTTRRRRLGAACILGGKILSVNIPRITVQSIVNKDLIIDLMVRHKLLSYNPRDIQSLQDKPVRILLVCWNTLGFKHIEYPEIFSIEAVNDPLELVADDITGFTRLRSKLNADALSSYYPDIEISKLDLKIKNEDGRITLSLPAPEAVNQILGVYIQRRDKIRKLRNDMFCNSLISPVHSVESIFDKSKLRLDGLITIMKEDTKLLKCFVDIVKRNDDFGSLLLQWSELVNTIQDLDHEESMLKIEWLKNVGFLRRTEDGIFVTARGTEAAYLLTANIINSLLKREIAISTSYLISIIDLERESSIATSLLLRGLKNFEKDGELQCSRIDGRKCNVFWFILTGPERQVSEGTVIEFQRRLETVLSIILQILVSVPHSLAAPKIIELMKRTEIDMSYITLKGLLSELETRGKIIHDGNSWHYPWTLRVRNMLAGNPHSVYTVDDLSTNLSIPPAEKDEAMKILLELKREGVVVDLFFRYWTHASNVEVKAEKILKNRLKEFILKTLIKNRDSVAESVLSGVTLHHAYDISRKNVPIHPQSLYKQVIEEMLQRGEVYSIDGIYHTGNKKKK